MENAIPSMVIGAILLIASTLVAGGSLNSYESLSDSMKEMQTRTGEQVRTRLSVTTATVADPETLNIDLLNDGQSRIGSFARFDLIVTYYVSATEQTTLYLSYDDTGLESDAWDVPGITNDAFEPGLLNPGETANLEIRLSEPAEPGKAGHIVISSESGSSVSATFTS